MKPEDIPIFITAGSMTLLAVRALVADRFRNPITDWLVLLGGILPWFTVVWLFDGWPESVVLPFAGVAGLFLSGPIFFGALLRYWLGHHYFGWERATVAMVTGILATLGFHIAVGCAFHFYGR